MSLSSSSENVLPSHLFYLMTVALPRSCWGVLSSLVDWVLQITWLNQSSLDRIGIGLLSCSWYSSLISINVCRLNFRFSTRPKLWYRMQACLGLQTALVSSLWVWISDSYASSDLSWSKWRRGRDVRLLHSSHLIDFRQWSVSLACSCMQSAPRDLWISLMHHCQRMSFVLCSLPAILRQSVFAVGSVS